MSRTTRTRMGRILHRLYGMDVRQWRAAQAIPTVYAYIFLLRIRCRIPEHGGKCRGVLPVLVSSN